MPDHPWFKGIVEHRWTREQIILGEIQHYLRVRTNPIFFGYIVTNVASERNYDLMDVVMENFMEELGGERTHAPRGDLARCLYNSAIRSTQGARARGEQAGTADERARVQRRKSIMTTLGRTVFVILSLAVLIGGTLALRSKPEPLPRAQLSSAQVAELQPAAKPAHMPGRRVCRPSSVSSTISPDTTQMNSSCQECACRADDCAPGTIRVRFTPKLVRPAWSPSRRFQRRLLSARNFSG